MARGLRARGGGRRGRVPPRVDPDYPRRSGVAVCVCGRAAGGDAGPHHWTTPEAGPCSASTARLAKVCRRRARRSHISARAVSRLSAGLARSRGPAGTGCGHSRRQGSESPPWEAGSDRPGDARGAQGRPDAGADLIRPLKDQESSPSHPTVALTVRGPRLPRPVAGTCCPHAGLSRPGPRPGARVVGGPGPGGVPALRMTRTRRPA